MTDQFSSTGGDSGDTGLLSASSTIVSEILQSILSFREQEKKQPDCSPEDVMEVSSILANLHVNETEEKKSASIDASKFISPLGQLNAKASEDVYKTIKPDEVRILILYHGQPEDEIHCGFTYTTLEQAPRYEALSYTWGSESNPKRILVCSQPFYVTESLGEALQHLRQPTTDRYIWIDALCINQSSIPDRNSQVQKMREIYATAIRVIIWLGTGHFYSELDSAKGVDMLINAQYLFDLINHLEVIDFSESWLEAINESETLYLIRAIGLTLELDYWDRVWIVQEIAHAREAILQFGFKTAKYNSLVRFLKHLSNSPLSKQRFYYHIAAYSLRGPNRLMRPGAILDGEYISIKAWQTQLKSRTCQDPRDRVFGYHGCLPPDLRKRIQIDYSKTEFEVFKEATLAILQQGHLPIISWAKGETSPYHPLSWVPTFGRSGGRNIAYLFGGDGSFPPRSSPRGQSFTLRDGDTTLELQAAIVGEVRSTHRYPPKEAKRMSTEIDGFLPSFFWEFYCTWRRLLEGHAAAASDLISTMAGGAPNRLLPDELFEGFVDGVHVFFEEGASDPIVAASQQMLAKPRNRPSFTQDFASQSEMVQLLVNSWLEHRVRKFTRELGTEEYSIIKQLKGISAICAATHLFSFEPIHNPTVKFPTNNFAHIGLANDAVAELDKVCIVDGINAVVILREAGDHYTFVSSAFVGSYMEKSENTKAKLFDAVWEAIDRGDAKLQPISIR